MNIYAALEQTAQKRFVSVRILPEHEEYESARDQSVLAYFGSNQSVH